MEALFPVLVYDPGVNLDPREKIVTRGFGTGRLRKVGRLSFQVGGSNN